MSKDAKIGFAIGGVLLAVLVVYLVVVPRHHRVTHPTVAVVNPPAGTAPVEPTPLAETPTTAPALADRPADSSTPVSPASLALATDPFRPSPAGPLAEATSTGAAPAGNGDWNKLFPSQPSAPSLMASDVSTPSSHTASPVSAGSVINSGASTATDAPNDGPAWRNTAASDVSRGSHSSDLSAGRQYTVRSGETFSSIAADVYGNSRFYLAIMKANPSINPNRLRVGTKLSLPASAEVKSVATAAGANAGTTEATASDESASGYESGGPAGGGIILASPVTPQTETVVSPASPVSSASADSNGFYTVKRGDTLFGISKKLYGNLHEAAVIYSTNQTVIGPDKAKLKVGTVLQLPSTGAVEAAANAAE